MCVRVCVHVLYVHMCVCMFCMCECICVCVCVYCVCVCMLYVWAVRACVSAYLCVCYGCVRCDVHVYHRGRGWDRCVE